MNVLTSISFSNDSYRISVGSSLQLTTVREPESAPYTLRFVSDDESVAVIDDGGLVTAMSEGVAQITVIANDSLTATCSVTVVGLTEVPDIASFLTIQEGDEALLMLTNAQVLYAYSGDIYLRDASGSLMLSGTGLNVNRNDVLNGSILGRLTYSNLMPQLTPAEGESSAESISISSGEAAQPVPLFGEQLTADRYSNMVLLRGTELIRDGGVFAVVGERRIRLWNKFQIKSPKISLPSNITDKYYDITAIYGTDVVNGEVIEELYLLSSPVEGDSADGLRRVEQEPMPSVLYNLQGQRVGKNYKGIVVEKGRKFLQK